MCEITVAKSAHGWYAESKIDVGQGFVLCFFTMKRYSGELATIATRRKSTKGGGTLYSPSTDFSEVVINQEKGLGTRGKVKAQHMAALRLKSAIIARMKEFYQEDRSERPESHHL